MQLAAFVELKVVGDEGLAQVLFDHGVATLFDVQQGFWVQGWALVVVFFGKVGVSGEGIGFCQRAGAAVEGVAVLVKRGKEGVVVLFFQRQSLVARV